jgi:3-hydroxybutyryl-CoA dehydrogenase
MGAGIAQIGCLAEIETRLHDPVPDALTAGHQRVREALERGVERERWTSEQAVVAEGRLKKAEALEDLAGCELVIEAAPEELGLKQKLFAQLAEVCGPETILATNTSSLSVTAIAAGVPEPRRVVGMHFFNPPAQMELVEVVAGPESFEEALELVTEVAKRMGRTPVRAADEIGFLGNRCARPFSLEALRLLGDQIADAETIDRICRVGGGFRMGPFELMDLVGIDVNFEVAKSFWEQSFHEPRWQPHPIQQQMVSAGRLGRKTGRGYYDYSDTAYRSPDPEVVAIGEASGDEPEALPPAEIVGDGLLAKALRGVALGGADAPRLVLLAEGSLAELDDAGTSVGFHLLGPLESARLVELTAGTHTPQETRDGAEDFFAALGLHVEWVGDSPGLVLGRIVCQLVNEAAFALQKGIGSAADIDTAMRLGFNYPRGPLEWGDAIGLDHVLAVLDALHGELGEERYRAAPVLRRMVSDGELGRSTGRGFLAYETPGG